MYSAPTIKSKEHHLPHDRNRKTFHHIQIMSKMPPSSPEVEIMGRFGVSAPLLILGSKMKGTFRFQIKLIASVDLQALVLLRWSRICTTYPKVVHVPRRPHTASAF